MEKKERFIFGIGVNDCEGKISINRKHIKSYNTWIEMLRRCYSEKYQERQPTYKNCSVYEEWLSFTKFQTWFDSNYRFDLEELGIRVELDKDLLVEDNKIYSAENCIFLPQKVNGFLTNKKSNNSSGYIGVSWDKARCKWRAHIHDFDTGKLKHLGRYTNIELANQAYTKARELEVVKVKQYLLDLDYRNEVIDKIK